MSDPQPHYHIHVFCCTNVRPKTHPRGSCGRGNSIGLRNYMKVKAKEMGLEKVRINAAGCLDRCELGPNLVIYPDGVWYHYETEKDVDEILDVHVRNRGRVERLLLKPEDGS